MLDSAQKMLDTFKSVNRRKNFEPTQTNNSFFEIKCKSINKSSLSRKKNSIDFAFHFLPKFPSVQSYPDMDRGDELIFSYRTNLCFIDR